MSGTRRRLAAIMFTDMVGYSARAQADEAAALADLEVHNALLRPIFAKFHGLEVKTVGDAFLVEFESALEAARCALDIQRALHDLNAARVDGRDIRVRIGIHVGDVVETDGDVLGDAVNIASRIEPLAAPGGICLTQQVYDQIRGKIQGSMVQLPTPALKNIRTPTTVYRMVPAWELEEERSGSGGRGDGHSLAVLPLANISPDPRDEYLADGLTEEIISTLSHVQDLRVTARTSVAPYKLAPKSIAQVGAELGVDTVIEGSVRKAGNRIRITLQLVDVSTQRPVWSNSYDRELDDVFAVQTDIAQRTAHVLRVRLGGAAEPVGGRPPTSNPEAYDLYLRALAAEAEPEGAGIDRALRCFAAATSLDPDFAEAYGAWADLYVIAAGEYLPVREVLPRAKQLAARALELDPNSSNAHAALGNIAMQFDQDWPRAEAELRRAIALNPSNVSAHRFLALLLIALGRFDEAKEVLRTVLRLDPHGNARATLAWAELESGNFDAAIAYARSEVEKDPNSLGRHFYLGLSYLTAGRLAEAIREAETPVGKGATENERFDLALLNALVGRPQAAREIAAEVERGRAKSYTSACHLAMLYGAAGEKEKALTLLEKDLREGDRILWLYFRGLFFDSLRTDPRFVAMLGELRLPSTTVQRARPSRSTATTGATA